jgi:hypothetical protein
MVLMAQCRFALQRPLAQYLHLKNPVVCLVVQILIVTLIFVGGKGYVDVGK